MRLVTRIKQGKDRNDQDMWVVGVEDTDANKVVATLPCSSDEQAEVLALLWQIFAGAGFPNHFFCDS
jgi:hypothetical protein